MFIRDDGICFQSREEAWDDMMEWMDEDDFQEYFSWNASYTKLLNWAKKQEGFWDDFADEILSTNTEFFNNFYSEIEEEEEE